MKQNKQNISALQVTDVCKNYGNIEAVKNISFSAETKDIIALLGPNGAGKSTLMNMIAGYLSPSSGKIYINGNSTDEKDLQTKKDIGFLPEGSPLYADMTVKLFLQYFIELKLNLQETQTLSKKQITELYKQEFERIITTANITDVCNQRIETLSKGYTRRVGFATSLIGNPPILLLDEPTDGLDPNQKEHMRHLIKEMSKNKTIVISTHLLDEAEALATKIILIDKGQIKAEGSVKEILNQTKKKTLEAAFKALTTRGETDE